MINDLRWDAQLPIAIFLGPSLPLAEARTILPANYYPPIRMGDIYRLLASGVKTIAIIDGVFHETTPVWQREILTALDEGIEVVGGASMGALRAAELAPHGMRGVGTVYDWYRDGTIEGDDEVALVHTDATTAYAPLSWPLVNLRHCFALAVTRNLLTTAEHVEIVSALKQSCFTDRTFRRMQALPVWRAMDASRRDALEALLGDPQHDLKRADAHAVLTYCATPRAPVEIPKATAAWSYPGSVRPHWQAAITKLRGFVAGGDILREALTADDTWAEACLRAARARFYALEWLATQAMPPSGTLESPTAAASDFCRANGITQQEYVDEKMRRARFDWLQTQAPATHGLSISARTLRMLQAQGLPLSTATFAVAAWAAHFGVSCPDNFLVPRVAAVKHEFELAAGDSLAREELSQALTAFVTAEWLCAHDPTYFGFEAWSRDVALLRELQLDGRAAAIAERLAADDSPAHVTHA